MVHQGTPVRTIGELGEGGKAEVQQRRWHRARRDHSQGREVGSGDRNEGAGAGSPGAPPAVGVERSFVLIRRV